MNRATALVNRILMALSAAGLTVWRNNTAQAWAGRSFTLQPGEVYRAKGGERVVLDARPIKAGLTGSGDVIGFAPTVITADMVGQTFARFGSWEAKDGTGRPSPDQRNWANHVREAGGLGGIVRSETEALDTLTRKG